jgi:chemotaxis protein histidine kinase CheA
MHTGSCSMDGGLKEKKMNINIEIKGQQAKIVNRHEIVSGIAKLEGIEFIFSNEWDSFTKTAVIYVDEYDKTTAIKLLVENNKIEASQLPSSLFKEDCELFVGIFGDSENGQRITSTVVCQPIKEGTPVDAADEACPDIYNQIINIMSETKTLVKEATDKVEINGEYLEKASEKATDAENSAKKTKEYLNAAEQNKSEVEKLTEQSKKYSESASSSAESASKSASSASVSASYASQSALNAEGSATNAGTSATKAAASEKNAKASEESVKKSESNVNQAVTEFEQKRADSIAEINKTTTDSQNAINTLTTNSKKEISDLTETKKAELNKINDDITQNAGELKEAIVNAADAKKEEINQKGLEVLASIPEEFSKVEDTTLIKPTESGTEMMLTDSSDMNIQELHLFGKTEQKTTKGIQLLNLKDAKGGTGDGVTYTPNGDGSFKKTGTATGQAGNIWLKGDYYSDLENRTPIITLEVGKSYYIKDCAIFQGKTIILSSESGQVINVTEEKYPEGIKITGIRNTGFTLNKTYNEVIYPIVAESSTAVDWEEYTGGQPSPSSDYPQEIESVENPTVKIVGKNKMKTYLYSSADYRGGVLIFNEYLMKGDTYYTLSADFGNSSYYVNENIETAKKMTTLTGKTSITFKTVKNIPLTATGRVPLLKRGAASKEIPQKLMLVEGKTAEEYEEYTEQTAQLTCELNGIDDVKDELIVRADGTGQIVQKIYYAKKIKPIDGKFNKDESRTNTDLVYFNINTPLAKATTFAKVKGYSNIFSLEKRNIWTTDTCGIDFHTNTDINKVRVLIRIEKNDDINTILEKGVDIQYELKEPIVTNLSAEEVQKILALHTNKPNTTIWNDQNADMQITYVADTKSYIDKKFKELSDAIVASASEAE